MWRCLVVIALAGCGGRGPHGDRFLGGGPMGTPFVTSCQPEPFANGVSTWLPPSGLHQGRCSSAQLDDFMSAFLPGDATARDQWMIANQTCGACLWNDLAAPSAALGPILSRTPPLTIADGNIGGCVGLFEGPLPYGGCGRQVEDARDCELGSCRGCPLKVNADVVAFDACLAQAGSSFCQSTGHGNDCIASVPGAERCRPDAWPTSKAWLRYLGELFCGAPTDL